ncbi:phage tail sheath subtilisin-like domain-containing protein [Pelomicrobium methylotrophicum]|uniref:Phage tail sheath family protein n=1 Tax=Pelomicrobium methylotrophicum TaxID=2602750 RepID=A0A5C7EIP8_9PROT|nr:phage tail sheath subtilisin-like domain-containing protein [Pelomicrobium methylotrophicum]TXF11929.1 phage tail sheath family protein [Pelomicrobium methylotrophicum]
MPANFLHGVETIEIDKGPRPIRTVKTAVVGLIGTAPTGPVNTPTIVLSEKDAAQFGSIGDAASANHTIPQALDAIFDHGAGTVIVVNVFDPAIHTVTNESGKTPITAAEIIGTVDAAGKRTGLKALEDTYNLFGFNAKLLIAPGYATLTSVTTELIAMAGKLRAMALIDAPAGITVQQAVEGRGPGGSINFNTSSERAILCYPHLKVYDPRLNADRLEPMSPRLAGLMCATDTERGYWWSPSNQEFKGIVGVERPITARVNDPQSEANLLNENGIVTVFNSFGSGYRAWGNRSAAWPSVSHPKNFINVRRTADVLHESVEYAMLQFIDRPINDALIDDIKGSVNAFIRTLIGRGALIDGSCTYDPAKNPPTELAAGHLTFDISFMPPTPAERISFESFIDINLLSSLGGQQ